MALRAVVDRSSVTNVALDVGYWDGDGPGPGCRLPRPFLPLGVPRACGTLSPVISSTRGPAAPTGADPRPRLERAGLVTSEAAVPSSNGDSETRWRRWSRRWIALSAPGACLALLVWGVPSALCIGIVSWIAGGTARAILLSSPRDAGSEGVTSTQPWRACARSALATAAIVVGLCGLGAVFPLATFFVVLLLVLSSPPVATALRRRPLPGLEHRALDVDHVGPAASTASHDTAPPLPLLLALLAEPACRMSQPRLCRAWRQSFVALESARTVAERVRLVQLRQSYLDELEVRDAAALRAWLAHGARAAGGPERYLVDGDLGRPDAT